MDIIYAARSLRAPRLKRELRRRRLTQQDVATRADVPQSFVSRTIHRARRAQNSGDGEKTARVWSALDALLAQYQPVEHRR